MGCGFNSFILKFDSQSNYALIYALRLNLHVYSVNIFHTIFRGPLCLDWIYLSAFGLPVVPILWIHFKHSKNKSESSQRNKVG